MVMQRTVTLLNANNLIIQPMKSTNDLRSLTFSLQSEKSNMLTLCLCKRTISKELKITQKTIHSMIARSFIANLNIWLVCCEMVFNQVLSLLEQQIRLLNSHDMDISECS